MSLSPPWIFTQLEGGKKVLTLAGADAPHGRPRQRPIVKDKISPRQHTIYYSGDGEPTRILFGDKYEPWELSGRFMDRAGGSIGYAQEKTAFVKGFVADKHTVSIRWGKMIHARGFIDSFEAAWESSGEIGWTLSISIDADDLLPQKRKVFFEPTKLAPSDYTFAIESALRLALIRPEKLPTFFKGSFFDMLASITAAVTAPFAMLVNLAYGMQSFERSLFGEIRRFRASVGQLKTALIIFRDTFQDFRPKLAMEGENAEAQLRFSDLQAKSAAGTLSAMAAIVDADRAARLAERGKMMGFYQVKDGDTWESMSLHIYGTTGRIDDLRLANGIEPGALPRPGAIYQLPR